MSNLPQIERYLARTISWVSGNGGPPRLAQAIHHAVFPGGSRFRPRLCLAVARACGGDATPAAMAAAVSVELLHCASLVHDDLPCFDDADLRRGRPSVHRAFGERLAVLAGDALIVLSFQAVSMERAASAAQRLELITLLGGAAGLPHGIAAGQAWECEPEAPLSNYHKAKTASLFAVAMAAGALASGADPAPWQATGERLGEAFQIADDIADVQGSPDALGKPAHRDAALGVPNAVHLLGEDAARSRFDELVGQALDGLPAARGAGELRTTILAFTQKLAAGVRARPAA